MEKAIDQRVEFSFGVRFSSIAFRRLLSRQEIHGSLHREASVKLTIGWRSAPHAKQKLSDDRIILSHLWHVSIGVAGVGGGRLFGHASCVPQFEQYFCSIKLRLAEQFGHCNPCALRVP